MLELYCFDCKYKTLFSYLQVFYEKYYIQGKRITNSGKTIVVWIFLITFAPKLEK